MALQLTANCTMCLQGVPLNQGNLAASLGNIIATYELTPKDKSLVVMPLFHVHGLMAGRVRPELRCIALYSPKLPFVSGRGLLVQPLCRVHHCKPGGAANCTGCAAVYCTQLTNFIGCWSWFLVWQMLPPASLK